MKRMEFQQELFGHVGSIKQSGTIFEDQGFVIKFRIQKRQMGNKSALRSSMDDQMIARVKQIQSLSQIQIIDGKVYLGQRSCPSCKREDKKVFFSYDDQNELLQCHECKYYSTQGNHHCPCCVNRDGPLLWNEKSGPACEECINSIKKEPQKAVPAQKQKPKNREILREPCHAGRCQGREMQYTRVEETGKVIAHECVNCHSVKFTDERVCKICEKPGKIYKSRRELNQDERCVDCLKVFLNYVRSTGNDITRLRLGMGFNFACPFCMVATDWINIGFKAKCTVCKAEGTNRMQICHGCEQLNFIYPNRQELCADCISSEKFADHSKEEEELKMCPFFCESLQVFTPFKEAGVKIGDKCSNCTVLTIQKEEQCCVCRQQSDPIYWYKGKNTCLNCFNNHKQYFSDTAQKIGGHKGQSKNAQLDEYEPNPDLRTETYFCEFCFLITDHYDHGLFWVCSACFCKGTVDKQICLKCEQSGYIYLNRGNMCMQCNLERHPAPEYQGEAIKMLCVTCQKTTSQKPFYNRLSYDELRAYQCDECGVTRFEQEQECPKCKQKKQLLKSRERSRLCCYGCSQNN